MAVVPITAALWLAEDAIVAALALLAPVGHAWWSVAPPETKLTTRLLAHAQFVPSVEPLTCAYVAQHQDGGGRREPYVGDEAWSGLVVVRCLSAVDDAARTGFALAAAAMNALSAPTGYALSTAWDRPISIPRDPDRIYARAGQWRVRIERTP